MIKKIVTDTVQSNNIDGSGSSDSSKSNNDGKD